MGKLTEKQKRFIDYYIQTGNASEACKLAGYNGDNLNTVGAQNLAKLSNYIQEKLKAKSNDRIASQDEVLEYLTDVMRGKIRTAYTSDRNKAAELLGKRYALFTEKQEVESNGTLDVNIKVIK